MLYDTGLARCLGTSRVYSFHSTHSVGTVDPQKRLKVSAIDKHKNETTPRVSWAAFVILQRNYEYLAKVWGLKVPATRMPLCTDVCDTGSKYGYDMIPAR